MTKKVKKSVPEKRELTCSICNGTGLVCDICGDPEAVCSCAEDEEPTFSDCETCGGKGKWKE